MATGEYVTADMAAYDSHTIGGECAGFVRADSSGISHRLTRVQVPDEVIVSHHSLHRPHTQSQTDNSNAANTRARNRLQKPAL